MDPERAAGLADDLLNEEKLKDLTAADGTLPGGAFRICGVFVCTRALLCRDQEAAAEAAVTAGAQQLWGSQ